MSKDFDFEHIGKRMPYTTPEGFLDNLEDSVFERIQKEESGDNGEHLTPENGRDAQRKSGKLRLWVSAAVAMAACTALFFAIGTTLRTQSENGIDDIENAFCQLSPDDQTYLLDIYQDEYFFYE